MKTDQELKVRWQSLQDFGENSLDDYIAGYRAAESDLAPAVRLAECAREFDDLSEYQNWLDAFDKSGMHEALDAYRATKAQPARDPLTRLNEILNDLEGITAEEMQEARALCAEAIRRAK